jgi:integrase
VGSPARRNHRRGGPPSPASLDLELTQLKRMCSYAVECSRLPANPVARVKLLRKPNVRTVTVDEPAFANSWKRPIPATAQSWSWHTTRACERARSSTSAGLRSTARPAPSRAWPETITHVSGLTVTDVSGSPRQTWASPPSTNSSVAISTPAQQSLLEYVRRYAGGRGGALFEPWSNVRRDLNAACKRARIAPCSPNDLRRTFGNWMVEGGVPRNIVAEMMVTRTRGCSIACTAVRGPSSRTRRSEERSDSPSAVTPV